MHKFFVSQWSKGNAVLSPEDSTHAARVLRMKAGDKIIVCDGAGFDYDGEILSVEKAEITVMVSNKRPSETEPFISVSLIQCLPKAGKMEVIIQKCVELGVSDFYPVNSIRCVARPDPKSAKAKVDRLQKVAYEAAKQSERGIIPRVHEYGELLKHDFSQYDVIIIPYEEESVTTLKRFVSDNYDKFTKGSKVAVVIGTEGGFERSEVDSVVEKGGVSVTLGKRILRTETAGMATVAMMMGLLEG